MSKAEEFYKIKPLEWTRQVVDAGRGLTRHVAKATFGHFIIEEAGEWAWEVRCCHVCDGKFFDATNLETAKQKCEETHRRMVGKFLDKVPISSLHMSL